MNDNLKEKINGEVSATQTEEIVQAETFNSEVVAFPVKKRKSLGLLIPIMIIFTVSIIWSAICYAKVVDLCDALNQMASGTEEAFVLATVTVFFEMGLTAICMLGYPSTIILSVINIIKWALGVKKKIKPIWMLILSIVFLVVSIVLIILIIIFINHPPLT